MATMRVTCSAAILIAATSALAAGPAAAQTPPGGTAVIEWQAPGDDGWSGLATRYELRYRAVPVLAADTLVWWNAGTVVTGLPSPGLPGATDSVVVSGLNPSQTYYFMLRVADEIPNWSGWSNVVVKPAFTDAEAPATIRDLRVLPEGLAIAPPPPSSSSDPSPEPPR